MGHIASEQRDRMDIPSGRAGERYPRADDDELRTTGPTRPTNTQDRTVAPQGEASRAAPKPIPATTRLRIWFVRSFLLTWIRCFSLSGLYQLGRFFGLLEYLVDYKRRRRVSAKLYSLFKDERTVAWRRGVARKYFMRIRCDKMFYIIMDRIPRGKLMNRIKLKGKENIDRALADGRGLYVALCHFGSHHIAGLMMALLGYELAGVRDQKESAVRRYIQQKYRETFLEVSAMQMFAATSFPRGIYRHLQDNKIVASLLDADRKRGEHTKTYPATIFGEQRAFLIGPLQIAIRCGSKTLQGFVVSRRNFYYQLIVTESLIDPDTVVDEAETLSQVIQRYADGVEAFARRHPDHLMNI